MSAIEDRAFAFSLRDTLQKEFPLSKEENYIAMSSFFSYWCISDTLMLSGMDIGVNELTSILQGLKADGKEERIYCIKNAVEVMFLLGKRNFYDTTLVARMRGELEHFGGYHEESYDSSFALALENKRNTNPLIVASDLFLSNWNDGVSHAHQKEMALRTSNAYLIQNGFVPIMITKSKLPEFKSAMAFFSNDNDPDPFRDFITHQEYMAIYNYLCYMMKRDQ